MIDPEIRAKGIGASEIAAVVGIDHRRSAFDVYAEKVGLLKRSEPTARMRWGKRLERVIADCYAEETKRNIVWYDKTLQHELRSWQVFSPDAFVVEGEPVGGLDCKNVAWDQFERWGEAGTDSVPDTIALQCQWSCSAADLPWWDVAALAGGNDLRIYRVHRDAQIEAVLLQAGQAFWTNNVLPRVAPVIESTDAAREYLRQRYPRNIEVMRPAGEIERALIAEWQQVKEEFNRAEKRKDALQLQICDLIGDADGINFPVDEPGKVGRVMWKLGEDVEVAAHVRKASRRFDCRVVKARIGDKPGCAGLRNDS
jgi:putative phage-type endonuclease